MKKFIMRLTAILTLTAIITGCGGAASETASTDTAENTQAQSETAEDSESTELTDCKLAYVTWVGIAPWFIARDKGFFEKNGLNVDLTLINDETTYPALLSKNEINATGFVLDSYVSTTASGVDLVCPIGLDASVGGDGIIAAEGINTIEDLKGKTVALDKSSTPYYFFCRVLSDHGMTEDDVTISDMTSGDAGSAFLGGGVDAAVVWEPWLTNASQREGGHVLVSTVDYPTSIVDGLAVTRQYYEENPDGVEALIQSWYDAVEYYKENVEEGNQIMADGLEVSLEEFESMVSTVKYFDKEMNESFYDKNTEGNIYDTVSFISDFWKGKGTISEDYDYTKYILGAE